MLYHDRIDLSEGIGVNKTNESLKYIICQYYYFLEVGLEFQPKVPNGCHDLMEKTISFNVAVISVKENEYIIHFINLVYE